MNKIQHKKKKKLKTPPFQNKSNSKDSHEQCAGDTHQQGLS